MDEARLYRRNQNALFVAGQSAIMLSAWSIVKLLVYLTMDREYIYYALDEEYRDKYVLIIIFVFFSILFIVNSVVYYKIGINAIKVAMGARWKKRYFPFIVFCILYILFTDLNVFNFDLNGRLGENISVLFIDIFLIFIFIAILYFTYKIYRYRDNQLGQAKEE